MIKWLARTTVFIILAFLLSQVLFQAETQRFLLNVKKYTTMNIKQNEGWRRHVLTSIDIIASVYPTLGRMQATTLDKMFDNVHAGAQTNFSSNTVVVSNIIELSNAFLNAKEGQHIVLLPGKYNTSERKLQFGKSGSLTNPIIISSTQIGKAIIEIDNVSGLRLSGANIIIEGIVFKGVCDLDQACEHAIHIKGNADNVTLVNNDFVNFNAHIKSNGEIRGKKGVREFPDYVSIINNRFYNEWVRDTRSPVTPLDIVGGDYWTIKNNFIADFSKRRGNHVAYGGFLKGGGEHGVFESNVVACEWNVPNTSVLDVRIGLSFGGGGTGHQFCKNGKCDFEHRNGLMQNNLIANCQNDVAVYIKKGVDIVIDNNRFIYTQGIDAGFGSRNIMVSRNQMHGMIRKRDTETTLYDENNDISWPFNPILKEVSND